MRNCQNARSASNTCRRNGVKQRRTQDESAAADKRQLLAVEARALRVESGVAAALLKAKEANARQIKAELARARELLEAMPEAFKRGEREIDDCIVEVERRRFIDERIALNHAAKAVESATQLELEIRNLKSELSAVESDSLSSEARAHQWRAKVISEEARLLPLTAHLKALGQQAKDFVLSDQEKNAEALADSIFDVSRSGLSTLTDLLQSIFPEEAAVDRDISRGDFLRLFSNLFRKESPRREEASHHDLTDEDSLLPCQVQEDEDSLLPHLAEREDESTAAASRSQVGDHDSALEKDDDRHEEESSNEKTVEGDYVERDNSNNSDDDVDIENNDDDDLDSQYNDDIDHDIIEAATGFGDHSDDPDVTGTAADAVLDSQGGSSNESQQVHGDDEDYEEEDYDDDGDDLMGEDIDPTTAAFFGDDDNNNNN